MTLLSLQEVADQYNLSIRKATQIIRCSGAMLPRTKGQKYIVVKEKLDKYLMS